MSGLIRMGSEVQQKLWKLWKLKYKFYRRGRRKRKPWAGAGICSECKADSGVSRNKRRLWLV